MFVAGLVAKVVAHAFEPDSDALWIFQHSLPTHADWFAVGMAVAVAHVFWQDGLLRLPRGWQAVAVAAAVAVVLVGTKLFYSGTLDGLEYQTAVALACALILAVLVLSAPGNVLERGLTLRPLVFAGLVSYSLFLAHDPIIRAFRDWGLTFEGLWGFAVNLLILGGLSYVVAALVYRYVERPALARKRGWQAGDAAGLGSSAPPSGASSAPDLAVPLRPAVGDGVLRTTGDPGADLRVEFRTGDAVTRRPADGFVHDSRPGGGAPLSVPRPGDHDHRLFTNDDNERGRTI
jgi:peptidoglycan/LPS O-acetylase OafA/YrhL